MHIFIFMSVVSLFLGTLSFIYLYKNFTWTHSTWYVLTHLLLTVNIVGSRFLPEGLPIFWTKVSAWLSGLAIAGFYYIMLLGLIHLLLSLAGKIAGFKLPGYFAAAGMVVAALVMVQGCYQAFHPTLRTEKIITEKLPAGSSYKIAFITDVHLGKILGHDYAERLVERVNALQPDMVLISGDLLDERIRYVEEQDSLSPLAQFNAPDGAYLGLGNHDYLDDTNKWLEMVRAANILPLHNAEVIINDQVKIAGIADFSKDRGTAALQGLAGNNGQYYSILLDHQPRRMDAAAAAGYDLYLAGHTHTGQLFPLRLITKNMYKLDYGRANFGDMTAITNNGYGFWGPPLRNQIAPELVMIELEGK